VADYHGFSVIERKYAELMSVPERVPESAGIIWTLQSPKTVRRTQDKDDCQQRSSKKFADRRANENPDSGKQPRMIVLLLSNGRQSLETLLWLRLRERHARNIEVLGDINSTHAFAPEIIRDLSHFELLLIVKFGARVRPLAQSKR
jgi:hypothetical protein